MHMCLCIYIINSNEIKEIFERKNPNQSRKYMYTCELLFSISKYTRELLFNIFYLFYSIFEEKMFHHVCFITSVSSCLFHYVHFIMSVSSFLFHYVCFIMSVSLCGHFFRGKKYLLLLFFF